MRKRFCLLLAFYPGLFLLLYSNLNAQVYNGDLTLTTQAEVDAFNYTQVTGNLTIDDLIDGNITNFNGLSELTSVGGSLVIQLNDALNNVNGLSNLISVGGTLDIYINPALPDIDGLSNISSVGGSLSLVGNTALTNVDGLSNLTSVISAVISSNDGLSNLNGLSNLTTVVGLGASGLGIANNNSLLNIDGLSNLTSVGGNLFITNNDALLNINGLANLTSVGNDFLIRSNDALINLNPLSNLGSVGADLTIQINSALTEFCGLYTLFNSGSIGGATTIAGNAANPTPQQIIDGGPCGALPVQFILFNVKCEFNKVIINWKTAQEQNSSHFIVERSHDGISWSDIGNRSAAGNSNTERSYSFIDNNIMQGSFYRIAQYDIDGRMEYTSILRSSCNARDVFKVWPNPFNETVFVNISANTGSQVITRIFDNKGALIRIQKTTLLPGSNQINVDMKGLASGTYHLSAEWNNGQTKKTAQIIKR